MDDPIETKLAAARTRLILDKPFLGALVLRLPLTAAEPDWCPTTATDAKAFYYNRAYIDELTIDEAQFVLAHEALHCALSHFSRRRHRIKHRWDLACDLAINPLLVEDGLKAPPNALIIEQYSGMTAEEIYPLLDEKDDENETMDQHAYDSDKSEGGQGQGSPPPKDGQGRQSPTPQNGNRDEGKGDTPRQEIDENTEGGSDDGASAPAPLTEQEKETLAIQWQQRMAGATQQAMQAGKLGGSLARIIDHLLQPQLPWRMLLAHHISLTARDDFSYMRPSRREGSAILPSLRSGQIDLVIAVDTSGSIRDNEMREFIAEIDAIKGQVRARITFLPCDTALAKEAPWYFEPWEEFSLPDPVKRGGGTDFRPVFEWLEAEGNQPELLIYFTDAQGPFPQAPPNYPVLWLVKGKEKIPWGQRIQLN